MPANPVCANCSVAVPPEVWNLPEGTVCEGCQERIFPHVFRAFFVKTELAGPARLQAEGEASCFYHATNQAVIACESCGRFLCALCDLDLDGRHLCPACLDRGINVQQSVSLETRKTQYDAIALHLVTWPVLTVWLTIVAAPAALYLVIRHWKTQMSILPRTKIRLWTALFLAIIEICGVLVFIAVLVWFIPRMPVPAR